MPETKVKKDPIKAMPTENPTPGGAKGFRVVAEGEFFARNPNGAGNVIKPYKVKVNLKTLNKALSVLKGQLLPILLPKKYPEFIALRGQRITYVEPYGGATVPHANLDNLKFMDWDNLRRFAEDRNLQSLGFYPDTFDDIEECREYARLVSENPEYFKTKNLKRMKLKDEMDTLKELNPDLG